MSLLPDAAPFLALLLLGGWVTVDGTSVGQFMVSRPVVAATLAGVIVGNPAAGVAVGVILEAFHLAVLPVGAARYPEAGPPSVVAGAAYALSPQEPSLLLTAVVFALGWEWVSAQSMRALRQLNIRLASGARVRSPDRLERRHLAAIAADFARGVLLVVAGLFLALVLQRVVIAGWAAGDRLPRIALAAVLVALLASSARLFAGRTRLFVAGAALGALVHLVRV